MAQQAGRDETFSRSIRRRWLSARYVPASPVRDRAGLLQYVDRDVSVDLRHRYAEVAKPSLDAANARPSPACAWCR